MNPLYTTELWGRIYLMIGTSKIQCGSLMNKDQIYSCGGLSGVFVVEMPYKVTEFWAYSWDIYDMSSLTASVSSSPASVGKPASDALSMESMLWANSNSYFQSEDNTNTWWKVTFPTMIYIRRVLLFSNRSSNLLDLKVLVKIIEDTEDDDDHMCGGTIGSFNFFISSCQKTGNELIIRAPTRQFTLYYVGAIYQQASCAVDIECQSVESFSYQDAPLPVVMASPPTMTFSSVGYTNTCCPVAWFVDSTNQVTGTTISASQNMILAATAVNFHKASTKTLKFKLVYFDGTITNWSALLSRTVTITCLEAVVYKIDNLEQISVFTTSPGVITTKDYSTCLGGGTVTVTCDQAIRPGYAVVSGNQITMDFTKRVSTQFVDENYFVSCTHTSTTGQYYTDEYQVDSIDCSKGLQTPPNPALTLDSQTVALNTSQKFTILHNTLKSIIVSAFSIAQVPAAYGKQCGSLGYNIQAPSESGITITKPNDTTFDLNTSGYTMQGSSDTVTMKLTVSCPQFVSPIEYSFNLEITTVCTAANLNTAITFYNIYYLISGEAQTVELPYVLSGSYCFPLTYEYYDASEIQQPIPSWLNFGQTGNKPIFQIQLSDKTKKGRHRVDMLVPSQSPISFYLYLAALVEPAVMYSALQLNSANETWLTDVESTNFSVVYKWSVDDTQPDVSTRFQIQSQAMSIHGNVITQTKDSPTTTSGLTWTPDPNGDYELVWKILADKTQPDSLQIGTWNMQLTVSVAFTDIDGSGNPINITKTVSQFQLSLKSCSDASHFSAPAAPVAPDSVLYDSEMNALDATLVHAINVKNPKHFYIGAFKSSPCDFVANCCPLTYSGQAYRSDDVLISSQNGGVEILMMNEDLEIYDNQLNDNRLHLSSENFIQQITFKVTVSNGLITIQMLKFKLVNCEQNPSLTQPNITFVGVNSKSVTLEWQVPSSALDASCIPRVNIYAIDDTTEHDNQSFKTYLESLGYSYQPFISIDENTRPPKITLQPIYPNFKDQFSRTWKMKIKTRNGDDTLVSGQEWSDEKIFYLDMCYRKLESNNGVIQGQNLVIITTGIKYVQLKKSTAPSGSSVCANLHITYGLFSHPSWISLDVGTDPIKNLLSVDTTGLAAPISKTFDYRMFYYVNQSDSSYISYSFYTITISVKDCNSSDIEVPSDSWFRHITTQGKYFYPRIAKIYSFTIEAFTSYERDGDCGPTLYDQYIKVTDGTTVSEIFTQCSSFTSCYGYMLDATYKQRITIDLKNMLSTAEELKVTIVTTFYNAKVPLAQGLRKEWSQLTVVDCSKITLLTQPNPWMISNTYQIGSSGTELKSEVCDCVRPIEVKIRSHQQVCTEFSLVTTNTAYQNIFSRVNYYNTFSYNPIYAGTVNGTLQITCSLRIRVPVVPGVPDQLLAFKITLFNCSSPVETGQTYVYSAMLGSANPLDYEVTFPWSDSAISYLEFCNKFVYEFMTIQTPTPEYVTTPPTWVTLMNYNPITVVNGVNLKIKTSNQEHAGHQIIRKSLLVAGNQAVTHTVHICIYEPPNSMFTNADSTLTLKVLDFLLENCISFSNWNVIKKSPTCSSCTDASCGTASTSLSNYNFSINGQLLTTNYFNGLKIADDTTNNKKKLCWKLPDVVGYVFTMNYVIHVTTQSFTKDFTFQRIFCSDFIVVDPSPWIKQQPDDLALSGSGFIIFFPPAVQPTFEVQPYSNNNFCDSSGTCCSTDIVSSTVKTFYSTDLQTEQTGFMTSNAAVLTLLYSQVPEWLGSTLEKWLTIKVYLNAAQTTHFSFERTFNIKFVNCFVASQPNLSYLINRITRQSHTFDQAQNSCTSLIRIRQPGGAPITHSWFSSTESSVTQIKINNDEVLIDDSQVGDYNLQRYVETITSPVQKFNIIDFKLSLCKLTPPGNNGVDPSSITSFDIGNSTGTLKLAYGSVSSGIACSNILYSVSGLANSWMTYQSGTNQIVMNLAQSVPSMDIVYTLTYNDGVEPSYQVSFMINLKFVTCGFTVPSNWVSPNQNPTAFALIFEQDSEVAAVYDIQAVTMQSTDPACGTLTYSASATMTPIENTTTFFSMSGLELTVNLGARVSSLATFTMNVKVKIDITRQSETKEFTINFFDCRVASGTINQLPSQQFEVYETKSFTDQGYQGLDIRCAPFKILLAFQTSPGNWFSVTTAGTPPSFISYTSTAGQSPTLSFQVKHLISDQGSHSQCKLVLMNRTNLTKIESSIFTFTVCKAQVSQAFISPSSTALTGNVFNLVRSLTAAQPKLQVQLSSAYFDSTQPLCTYTSLTIVNLDTSLVPMTVQTTGQTETLVMDSFTWTSNGLVYSRELEVKLWHNTELVYFATAPHKFTVNIYDCEKDVVTPTKWILQDPQFSSSNDYLFQTGSGDHSLQITNPTRNYPDAVCGPLVFEISRTNPLAITNLVVDSSTGLITVKTPANVRWGPEVVNIKVKNSYAAITPNSFTFRVQVFDCLYEAINANEGSQPAVTEMVSTGPDWSYTWNAFTTSFPPCVIDTYEVACAEGAYNLGSNRCNRGFQYNTSPTSTATAALNSKTINPLTIYAQYHETQQISVYHEGEFTFTISAYNALSPTNKGSYSILVKIKTPCDNPLNKITAKTQAFVGNCPTSDQKPFCDDVHYYVFTSQSNPIAPFTVEFAYSCTLTYQIKLKEAGVEVDVPSFIRLINGAATTTAPLWLNISSVLNTDKDYSAKTLVLRASVQQLSQVTEFKLFVYNDCSKERVAMLNTGQTFNTNFTVGQDMMTGILPTYFTFGKVSAVQASDQTYCVVGNSGLSLRQLNKPSSFPDLFQFTADQANGNNRVHIKASKDADVKSDVCDLGNLGTSSCKIDFQIIATGLNGTYPFVATGWVDFKSECHLSLQYWDQINSPSADKWVWDDPDPTKFKQYYQINSPLVTLYLPWLTGLILPSGESFAKACGAISYDFTTPFEPITFVQPTSAIDQPKIQVYSKNPLHANKDDPVNFARAYALDLKASNSKGAFSVTYATTQARQDAMTFSIQDLCYGVTYSKPKIYFNDGRNTPRDTEYLLVVQPILFDPYDVKMYYQTLNINSGDSSKCGQLTYSGKQTGDPSVIKMGSMKDKKMDQIDGLYFNLYANNNKFKGIYNVTFTASLTDSDKAYAHLYPTAISIIEVHIEDCFVKSYSPSQPIPPKLLFNLFGRPQIVFFKDFVQVPACNYTQQFNLTAYQVKNGTVPEFEEGSQPQNSPFELNSRQRRITFETKLIQLVNTTYEFFITGHLDNSLKFQQSQVSNWGPFSAEILESAFLISNTAPLIKGIESGFTVYKGDKSTVTLGLVSDLENNKVSLVDWSVSDFASKWLKLSSTVNIGNLVEVSFDFDIPADTSEQQFTLYLSLVDDHLRQPIRVDYITYFKIIDQTSQNKQFSGFIETNKTLQEQYLQDLAPAGNPKQISISGGFIFEFDKPIDMARLGDITSWNSTNVGQKYFEFMLVPGDQAFYKENEANYRYEWNITNTTSTTITFQFVFSNYDIISQQETDKMRFKIRQPDLFVSEKTKKPTTFTTSLQIIPKQVRDAQVQQQIQSVTDVLGRFLKALSASSFINILLSSSLQFLWGMINALQIIVYTVLFNLKTPVNALEIEIMILQMVKFDMLKTDSLLQKIFNFDLERQPPLNSRFEKAKYESSNFVLNMGSMFLIQIAYLVIAGLVPLLRWRCHRQSFCLLRNIKSIKLFNNFSRFYLESMLEISINVLMTFKLMKFDCWKQSQLVFSNFWAYGNLCILVVMPVILCYVAMQYQQKYHTDWDYREQYDDIFSQLKGHSKLPMLYFTFFTLRRYIFALSLIAMPNRYLFQTFTQVIASIFFLIYMIDAKPHKDPKQGKMELFNEFTVSASLYFLFIFTDFCPDSTRRQQAGWAEVLLILAILVINVSVMMVQSFSDFKNWIKNWWARRKLRIMQRARLESLIAGLDSQIHQPSAEIIIQQVDEPTQIRQLQIQEPTVQEMLDQELQHHLVGVIRRRPPQKQAPVEQRIIDNSNSVLEEQNAPQPQRPQANQNDPSVQSILDYQLKQLHQARLRPPQKQAPVEQRVIKNFQSQFENQNAPRSQRTKAQKPQGPQADKKKESVQDKQATKHYIQVVTKRGPPQKQVHDHQRLQDDFYNQYEEQKALRMQRPKASTPQGQQPEHKEESLQDMLDYAMKHHLKAVPSHGPPQKQVHDHQRLLDNLKNQFENRNATRSQRPKAPTPQGQQDEHKEESVQDMLDYAIKHHLKAVPRHEPPQKQAQVDQRLIQNFYSQFENQNAPRRLNKQSQRKQANTKRNTTPHRTEQTDDTSENSSGCQLVLNGSTLQPQKRSQTPADVIEEYNHKREFEKQLFGNPSKKRRF